MEENTPLLGDERQQQQSGPQGASFFQAKRPRTIVFLLSLMVVGLAFSGSLGEVPVTRLMEDNLCRRYYSTRLHTGNGTAPGDDIDESLCKIDEIQTQLAYLNGWLPMIEAVIGLFVAFPYGAYADKKGRKPVLWLSLIGIMISSLWVVGVLALGQSVSIYVVLFSPAFAIIGGGGTVLVSAIYSAVADVVSEADRVSAFLTVSLGSLVGGLLGPLTASALMKAGSTWAPIGLSLVILLLGIMVLLFIPETIPVRKHEEDDDPFKDDSIKATLNAYIRSFLDQVNESVNMLKQPSLGIVLFAFLSPVPVAIATGSLFVQYVSKRFDWSMASAGYLLSVRSMVNIFVVLIIIPGLSKLLVSGILVKGLSAGEKDRVLAQGSAFALAVGFLLLGGTSMPIVMSGLIIKTLGAGLPSLCRSLAAYHTDAQNTSKLQTVIGITETVGLLVSAPTLAWMFSVGMKLGGVWMGLPYVALSGFLAITTVALCFVEIPTHTYSVSAESYRLHDVTPDTASIRSFSSHGTMASRVPLLRETPRCEQ